jgi:hypothetical protein
MTRWRKGTNDQDGDGRKGGSRKESDMAKKPTAKKADTSTVESGMEPGADTDALRAKLQKQFDKADAEGEPLTPRQRTDAFNAEFEKADPEVQAALVEEAEVGKQIRGY